MLLWRTSYNAHCVPISPPTLNYQVLSMLIVNAQTGSQPFHQEGVGITWSGTLPAQTPLSLLTQCTPWAVAALADNRKAHIYTIAYIQLTLSPQLQSNLESLWPCDSWGTPWEPPQADLCRESSFVYLLQRLSVAVQTGNSASVLEQAFDGHCPPHDSQWPSVCEYMHVCSILRQNFYIMQLMLFQVLVLGVLQPVNVATDTVNMQSASTIHK